MIKVGEHITIDFLGVKKDYSPEFYEKVIYKIAKAAKVEILNVASHKFEPQGFTLVALLSESHFSFHTFPERGVISFDFFTCGKVNPKVALKILRKEIDHRRVVTNAFKSIKEIEDSKYDKIFVDLNDDQYCIDLAKKNMKGLKRILKKGGVITAQVGSQDKKPKQVDNWCKVLGKSFGNVKLSGAYIPSFDCKWNFASSIMK